MLPLMCSWCVLDIDLDVLLQAVLKVYLKVVLESFWKLSLILELSLNFSLKSCFKMPLNLPLILSLILSLKLPLMCSWCVLDIDLDGPAPFMFIYGWWWCKVIFTSNWTFFGYVRLCWRWVGFVTILGGKKISCVIFTEVFITRPIVGNRKNISIFFSFFLKFFFVSGLFKTLTLR